MWTNFYTDGGWGMYPVSLSGFFLVAACVLLALRPEKRYVGLAALLGVWTLGGGVLGTAVGMINTFRYLEKVPAADQLSVAALGCAESLHVIVLSLIITIIASLIALVGAVRAARTPGLAK